MAEKWYRLENFRCPVAGCSGNTGSYNWVCRDDRTDIYIAQTGYMRCSRTGFTASGWEHYGQICTWRWDCGNHGDHPFQRFQYADFQGFTFALSHAVQLMNAAGATWVGALCVQLGKQYGRE